MRTQPRRLASSRAAQLAFRHSVQSPGAVSWGTTQGGSDSRLGQTRPGQWMSMQSSVSVPSEARASSTAPRVSSKPIRSGGTFDVRNTSARGTPLRSNPSRTPSSLLYISAVSSARPPRRNQRSTAAAVPDTSWSKFPATPRPMRGNRCCRAAVAVSSAPAKRRAASVEKGIVARCANRLTATDRKATNRSDAAPALPAHLATAPKVRG
mmetsp:Transcript_121647/g.389206  ORF Transcript_121647/g.389206 Transcript_121647/m.389206 type:complete len:209 (+) Transcript_121647:221-847(+)